MAVFYSFHYERDVIRVQLVRNLGLLEGQPLLKAQEWESVRAKGSHAIQHWIDDQMKYKSAVVVLIGSETAKRPWVQYEIQKAWNDKRPLLGIRIHGLSSMGAVDSPGPDPFTCIPGFAGQNPGIEIFDPTVRSWNGQIDSKATFHNVSEHLLSWTGRGRVRRY